MGLRMKDRQSLIRKVVPRYQKARKAEKEKILDEFVKNTGYSRNYAIHILATWGEVHTLVIDGKANTSGGRSSLGTGKAQGKCALYDKSSND